MEKTGLPVDMILRHLAEQAGTHQERLGKATDVLLGDLDTEIATTPYEVVYAEDRIRLKHYSPPAGVSDPMRTPLLVVYALINRETMLDLQPERSVVKKFLSSGINLYMLDWGYPTYKDRFLTIDDHVNGYLDNVVDFILKRERVGKINLMGICMGGTFCVIYSALHPGKIKNLVTTVSPTNFDTRQGLLHIWMKWLDVDKMIDTFGNMPGDLMNFGFLLLNPARLMIDKYMGFLQNMDNKAFVENFIRMEKWIFDSPDVPGETFRQFIKDLYQNNLLIENRLYIGGRHVDLRRITMPMLNIYARFDHLVPPEAAEKITGATGSTDTENVCLETGHIGIYVSSKTQKEFAPKIISWLRERDGRSERRTRVGPAKAASRRSRPEPPVVHASYRVRKDVETSHDERKKLFFHNLRDKQGIRDNQ
ncbi:MAG: class III poly(R)-hydroxyalkanoic acid synthase subunit PhaC [Desulfomonilia bacterium]